MDTSIRHNRQFKCGHITGSMVRLEWTQEVIYVGRKPRYQKLSLVDCSGVGVAACPVESASGKRDWSLCPHLKHTDGEYSFYDQQDRDFVA